MQVKCYEKHTMTIKTLVSCNTEKTFKTIDLPIYIINTVFLEAIQHYF